MCSIVKKRRIRLKGETSSQAREKALVSIRFASNHCPVEDSASVDLRGLVYQSRKLEVSVSTHC